MADGCRCFWYSEQHWRVEQWWIQHQLGESEAPSSGGGSWRIKTRFAGSCKDSVAVDLFYLPTWVLCQCLRRVWEVCLPTCEIGLVLAPTSFGGLLSLMGVLLFGGARWFLVEESDSSTSGKEMATSHHAKPWRSATTTHVDASDVRLLVPLKKFDIPMSGRWPALLRLLRPSPARKTGSFLQGLGYKFCFFQECFCKIWDVNHQICKWNINSLLRGTREEFFEKKL